MGKQLEKAKGITLIALVITIIVLLILAGVSIATLTGEGGILSKAITAKEKHLEEQYKEELNLIIMDEITERKTETKEELMIVSLDKKIREKEWVNEIYKCNSNGEEQETFETSTILLVESKEHYEFLVEVNEENGTAKIIKSQKGTGEKYTITYHPNGGTGEEEKVEIKQGFSTTLKECNYTKEQYKFVGWSENPNGEGERYLENAIYQPQENVTLYAIWEINVATITLNGNNETGDTKQVTVTKGKESVLPKNSFTKIGYKFLEWSTNADGTGDKYQDGASITIEQDIVLYAIWKAPETIEEAKNMGTVLNLNEPTTIKDSYGNPVKIPEGFKIASDSAPNVTGGIVIEDVNHGATAGSQFVWIPVGTVYTNVDKTQSKTITLGRYVFKSDGTIDSALSKTEPNDQLKPSGFASYFTEGLKDSTTGNTHAKDIVTFRNNATTSGGYYVGRFEARCYPSSPAGYDPSKHVTVKPNDNVYQYVTQPQAATLARGMYGTDKKFTSDLMNSYAWDTAIVFLQTFDNRTNKEIPYARQYSSNTSLASQGSNKLTDTAKQDKICNVWDMASNLFEWSTETMNSNSGAIATARGGSNFNSGYQTHYRGSWTDADRKWLGFRPILYL